MPSPRTILHLDVNSAYLSWTAAHRLFEGDTMDLRLIPAVIGGDESSRHGIVLAKSTLAKAHGIKTGTPLRMALERCPNLTIVPPDYHLYQKASRAMVEILKEYAPTVQQFSIDECFLDYTNMDHLFGTPIELAHTIQERMNRELGFTINIGISHNKLLAKMASDFTKPNGIHTLYPSEIAKKMWPLPVGDLFMVGQRTAPKLQQLGIHTIGDLANTSPQILKQHLHTYGLMLHQYANGIDTSPVRSSNFEVIKGIGNSTTVRYDVHTPRDAHLVLLSLCESVGMRLRQQEFCAGLVSISIVSTAFTGGSHQRKLDVATDSTTYLHNIARQLFDELWDGSPIRKLGVHVTDLQSNTYYQQSLFVDFDFTRQRQLDGCVDRLRFKYGKSAVMRASFLHSGLNPISGGIGEEGYPVMTSIL